MTAPLSDRTTRDWQQADSQHFLHPFTDHKSLAATMACGYLGIQNRVEPSPECKGDAYLGDFQLPRSLGEALSLLRQQRELAEVLGQAFITVYTEVKEIEHAEFMKVISPWEREHLLLHV